ncbi:double-strand break repair protein AddB [Novosphingobium sp. TH158]|uniref:double-strand break repair protein AddB n=1 Tax=Novosphingobium sp. TH158 TaxID=2067455 RepID=UPI000C79C642|nr:double-strand break repair protein AddB [Novosphingobium sp. TH158]PLK26271.1 double-strand break repair protein AddB [Novosphingobium sp. TH158]
MAAEAQAADRADGGHGPKVYSIAAHRGFADALVAGLLPRYGEGDLGLARLTLLLPSQRAIRTVTEAFVRLSGEQDRRGLLLPRMAAVGDLDIDETLGPLLDPLGAGDEIDPAVEPSHRWLRLAQILADELGERAPKGPALLRQAFELGRTMDRLLVEGIGPEELLAPRVIEVVGELAEHWRQSTLTFARVQARWLAELNAAGRLDAPARRNRLFDHAAQRWRDLPPATPIVAAGVTSASPSLARLLRVVSELPRGAVILPDLDLSLDAETWDALGRAGVGDAPGDAPFAPDDTVTHPQYHLKLLLNRMGVQRGEVQPWHRAGMAAAPPERSKAISNLFLPPAASARWVSLAADQRRLAGVQLMVSDHPGHEAQAIALRIREALETAEKRVAFITPDRALAARVIAHLGRWQIDADDTAGEPLPLTPAGRLFLQLAEVAANDAAPVPLLALLGHPYAGEAYGRADWLDHVRALDLALRGPRPGPGLAPLRALVERREAHDKGIAGWWSAVEALLSPLLDGGDELSLAGVLDAMIEAGEAISGGRIWGEADGRSLSAFVEDLRDAARANGTRIEREGLATALRDAMERIAVRKPWGGHPRVAVYGLIEARMSRADLVICGGLTEGTWPASPSPDALLAPPVLRALGVPGADFRIGLAAHDLAAALGAPEVVLSYARRDAAGPAIPSRFVLRVRAMLGADLLERHLDTRTPDLARRLTEPASTPPHPRPQPMPSAAQRDVPIAVTGLDRLRGDPYQFFASDILRLRSLDALDAEPTAAWKGTAVHAILERWHKQGGSLLAIADEELAKMSAHPLVRGLWWPRLIAGLEWIEARIAAQSAEGRRVLASEVKGHITFKGVKIKGRADRIDALADGTLAVVDYKTGGAPSGSMVQNGFALQLGLIGLMARDGAFEGVAGEPTRFEYWSLQKDKGSANGFGVMSEPVLEGRKKSGIPREDFLPETERFLTDAIDRWIKGSEPFTARLNPAVPGYADYDQLMRLDEWQGREEGGK